IIITIVAWLSFLFIARFLHNFKFKQQSIKYDPFTVLELERVRINYNLREHRRPVLRNCLAFLVLLIYFLVMIVGMPTVLVLLAIWWYRSKRHYSDKLLINTIQLYSYFIRKTPDLKWKRIITIISGSEELSPKYNPYMAIKHSQARDIAYLVSKTNVKQKKEGVFNQSFSHDDADKLFVQFLLLLSEFQCLVSTFIYQKMIGNITHAPSLDSFLMCIRLSCVIVQGLSVSDSSLMQLPHIDEEKLSFFQRRKKSLNTVQSFVELNEKDYNFVLKGFTDYQKNDIFLAIDAMPHLNIETALKVDDEINPVSIESLSIVSILIRIKRISLSKQFKFPLEIINNSPASCTNSFTKKEGWWIYVLDAHKQLVCIPVYFHFTQKYHQMVLQMFSSGDVGLLTYKCYIVSDSYVDFNYQKEIIVSKIQMNVVKQQPLVTDHPQWINDSDDEQEKVDSDVLTDSEEPITADLTVA
ncbi:hypothetical protein MXB_3435, partial [Myxobolus squamalis]